MTATWADTTYTFRRGLSLYGYDTVPVNHPITATVPIEPKIQPNFGDVVVYYQPADATPATANIITFLVDNPQNPYVDIVFPLQEILTPQINSIDEYYIYYNNPNYVLNPQQTNTFSYTPPTWPISITNTDPRVTYVNPGQDWVNGSSNISNTFASCTFWGTSIEVLFNGTTNAGIAIIQIDSVTLDRIDTWAPVDNTPITATFTDLGPYQHILRIQVTGQANAASSGTYINLTGFNIYDYINVIDNGEEVSPNITWTSIITGSSS